MVTYLYFKFGRMARTLSVFLASAVMCEGAVVSTPASQLTNILRYGIGRYLAAGGSLRSITPEEMEKHLQQPVTGPFAQENFLNRVVLLADKGPVLADSGGQMIAYTAHQIIEDRRETPGRYVLWVADGTVAGDWKTEEELAALLASKGLALVNKGVWKQPDTKHLESSGMMADTRSQEEKDKERTRMKAEDLKEDRSGSHTILTI